MKFKIGDKVRYCLLFGKWVKAIVTQIDKSKGCEKPFYVVAYDSANGFWCMPEDLKRGWK